MSGHATFPVLGIPTRFESDSPEVLRIAGEAFGAWRVLERDPGWIGTLQARVRIEVIPGEEGPEDHAPLHFAMEGRSRLRFSSPGSRGWSDAERREAHAVVTEGLVRDRQHFRYGVLEALALTLLTRLDREPLHAAALVRGDAALLLAGRSGVGKSTLAYAAVRAGLRVLTEDVVFLQLEPFRAWGMPGYLHVPADSAVFFPELDGTAPAVRANGKIKIAVGLRERGALAPRPVVDRAGVCLLRRGAPAGVEPLSPAQVLHALAEHPEEGFDAFAATIGERIVRLAEHGGWRLTLPAHPADAIPLLHQMFDALDRGPGPGAPPSPQPQESGMAAEPSAGPVPAITPGHPAFEHVRTSSAHAVLWPLTVRGALDVEVLRRALAAAARGREGAGVAEELELATVDLRQTTPGEAEAELRKLAAHELERPFDPGRSPLLRALLLRTEDNAHALLLLLHHVVSDGWSVRVLRDELAVLYAEQLRRGEAGGA